MKTSRATQYESPTFEQASFNVTSSVRIDSSNQKNIEGDFVNATDPEDIERLKAWSQSNWPTFHKSLFHSNTIYYHACCNSFSRRYFIRAAGHPALQTSTLYKMPSFRNVQSSEELFRWLLKTVKDNAKVGQQTWFPDINVIHRDIDEPCEDQRDNEEDLEAVSLKKRYHDLEKELTSMKNLLKIAESDNQRLVNSSRTWHMKYQELLDQKEPDEDVFLTPVKRTSSNNLMLFQSG